jgi:hypothetical protein
MPNEPGVPNAGAAVEPELFPKIVPPAAFVRL